jgi:hypothetical protein
MLSFVLCTILCGPAQVAIEAPPAIAVPAIPPVIGGRPLRVRAASPLLLTMQVKDGKLVSEQTMTLRKAVPVTETITTPDGNTVQVTKQKIQEVAEKQTIRYPVEGTTFQTAGGKKLDAEAALKLLRSPKLVVVVTGTFDETLLGALKPDTLIVMPPATNNTGIIRPGVRPVPVPLPAPAPAPVPLPPVKILPVPAPGAIAPLPAIEEAKPLPAPAVVLPAEAKPVQKPKK